MAKRKTFEEKNKFIHPTRKKVIDTVFGRDDNSQRVHGYESEEPTKRKVGEVWTDVNGTTWEQKDGYKSSVNKMDDVRKYLDSLTVCSSDDCQTKIYSNVDKKLIRKARLCLDCLQKFELKLKTDGTYPFYQDYKITRNKLAYAKELKQRYESALNDMSNKLEFVNENGVIENWKWDVDIDKAKQDIITDIESVTESIALLIKRKTLLEEKLTELNHTELIVK
jgi:hypothetical protein